LDFKRFESPAVLLDIEQKILALVWIPVRVIIFVGSGKHRFDCPKFEINRRFSNPFIVIALQLIGLNMLAFV